MQYQHNVYSMHIWPARWNLTDTHLIAATFWGRKLQKSTIIKLALLIYRLFIVRGL
jgi:hypothetical protein